MKPMNTEHFKGVVKTAPHTYKGVAPNAIPKKQRGSTDGAKGVAPGAHKEEPEEKKKDTSSLRAKEPTADEVQKYNEISKGIKDLLKGKRI